MKEDDLKDRAFAHLGIRCDGEDSNEQDQECQVSFESDLVVHIDDDQETKFGYILEIARKNGWAIDGGNHPLTSLSFCPLHKDQARSK